MTSTNDSHTQLNSALVQVRKSADDGVRAQLKSVLTHARKNTDSGWKFVDSHIAKLAAEPAVLAWVYGQFTGLRDKNRHVRDVAASVLELSVGNFKEKDLVTRIMLSDPNVYVRYRLAFAHARRSIRSDAIDKLLKAATTDKAVSEIAKRYIG